MSLNLDTDFNEELCRESGRVYLQTGEQTYKPLEAFSLLGLVNGETEAKLVRGKFYTAATIQIKFHEGRPVTSNIALRTPGQLVTSLLTDAAVNNPAFEKVLTDLVSLHNTISDRPTIPLVLSKKTLVRRALDARGKSSFGEKAEQLILLENHCRKLMTEEFRNGSFPDLD